MEYKSTMDAGREGFPANTELRNFISRTVETEAGIGFGKVVVQGAADDGVTVAAADKAFIGVTAVDRGLRPESINTFTKGESARIMNKGVIWVKVGEAVSAGDAAYFTASNGAFKKTASGNVAIPNARFDTSAASGGLAKLRLA